MYDMWDEKRHRSEAGNSGIMLRWPLERLLLTAVPDNMCGDSLHYRGHHGCWNGQGRNLDVQGSDFILRDVYSFYCVMSDLRG